MDLIDVKVALRRLRAAPVFTVFSIVTLACGIGVTTAVYSAMYALGARPLGLEAEDRLALLTRSNALNREAPIAVPEPDFLDLRTQAAAVADIAGWLTFGAVLAGPAASDQVSAEAVSGDYFGLLGAGVARGRAIAPADDAPGAAPVMVISDHVWRQHYDSSPAAIGARARLGGQTFEIVGVARRDFRGLSTRLVGGLAAWIPLSTAATVTPLARYVVAPAERRVRVVARLTPSTALAAASDRVAEASRGLDASAPLPQPASAVTSGVPVLRHWSLTSLDESSDFGADEGMRIVMAVPLLVLLVACTNLANLALSRSASRRHEYAVRGALGATRWRMIREALTESALVVASGAVLGIGLAHALLTLAVRVLREPLQALQPSFPLDWQLDPILLSGAGAGAIVSMLVAGVFPALRMTRVDPGRSLTTGDAVQSLPRWRGRSNLIALQIGVSATLFLTTSILARYFIFEPPPWIDTDPRLAEISLADVGVGSALSANTTASVVSELGRQPQVSMAAAATGLPFSMMRRSRTSVEVWWSDASRPLPKETGQRISLIAATPEFFRTVNIPIVAGRGFVSGREDRPVAIVDEQVAAMFRDANVVGRDVMMRARWSDGNDASTRAVTIIGVAASVGGSESTAASAPPRTAPDNGQIYVPLVDRPASSVMLIARPQPGDTAPLVGAFRTALHAVDPDLAIGAAGRGDVMATGGIKTLRLFAGVMGSLATLTIVLAGAGLYGALSDIVTRRTREMGIRLALGADTRRILAMVLRQGSRPIVEGMFIGFGSALVIRQLIKGTLTGPVSPVDIGVAVLAALPLVAAGLLAAYLPARRASRVNPNVALRTF